MLDYLCRAFLDAKADEDEAKKRRIALEEELSKVIGIDKIEGTKTVVEGRYKVSVTTKLTRGLDYDAYEALGLDDHLQFVDLKPTINVSRMRHIEAIDPSLIAACITTKPAKTSVTVVEMAA